MKTLLERAEFAAVHVAFRAIRESGMTIPDDISVLSADGLDMHLYPELFSLKIDRYRPGLEGAGLVKKVISNRKKGKNTKSVVIEYEQEKNFYGSVKAEEASFSKE